MPVPSTPVPPRRPVFSAAVIAALSFAALCIAAGAVVGFAGPRLFPRTAPESPAVRSAVSSQAPPRVQVGRPPK